MGFESYAALRAHRSLFLSHAVADVKSGAHPQVRLSKGVNHRISTGSENLVLKFRA